MTPNAYLGRPSASTDGTAKPDLLRANKALLILDNARDTAQVAPLLPPSPSAAIVTSRQANFGRVFQQPLGA